MKEIMTAVAEAIASFVFTNIDDLLILIFLFTQVNVLFSRQHIIIGQYLGFIVLVLASIPGFFGSILIPSHLFKLLGLIPIFLGLTHVIKQNNISVSEPIPIHENSSNWFCHWLSPKTYNVAAITIANGGDNISIYFPLFANSKAYSLIVIILTFLFLVGIWCLFAYQLADFPAIASLLEIQGNLLTPCVLIGIGVYIVQQSLFLTVLTLMISYLWVISINS